MIKAIIFDVDGTLYHSSTMLTALKNYWTKRIADTFHESLQEAANRWVSTRKQYGSGTEAMRRLGFGTLKEVTYETESIANRRTFIKQDPKLVEMVRKLAKHYQLLVLRNGSQQGTLRVLDFLGFGDKDYSPAQGRTFDRIFSAVDDFEVMKPDLKPFQGLMNYTKLKPNEHLMIGDRIMVDLAPAKKLGMQTALVTWGEKVEKHADVDYYLSTIYDVEPLLNKI